MGAGFLVWGSGGGSRAKSPREEPGSEREVGASGSRVAQVVGRVLTRRSGRPVPGIRATATAIDGSRAFAVTDRTGVFRFRGVPPNADLDVEFRGEDAWRLERYVPALYVGECRVLPDVLIASASNERREVRVLVEDRSGPITGAHVTLEPARIPGADQWSNREAIDSGAETGPDGIAPLSVVAADRAFITAEKEGVGRGRTWWTVGDSGPIRVRLLETVTLTGRVVDTDGTPVERCGVMLAETTAGSPPEGGTPPWRRTETGDDGRFRILATAPGPWDLLVAPPGGPTIPAMSVSHVISAPLELVIGSGPTIRGTVVDAADGEPVPGAVVTLAGSVGSRATAYRVSTDERGCFTARMWEGAPVLWLRAFASGRESAVRLPPSPGHAIRIEIPRTGRLEGRILGPAGPLAGAMIFLEDRPVALSDARGHYRVDVVPEGSHFVRAEHPGHFAPGLPSFEQRLLGAETPPAYRATVFPGETTLHDLRLERAVTARGRVHTADGRAIPGAVVTADDVARITDGEGWFELAELSPGERTLTVRRSGYTTRTVDLPSAIAGTMLPHVDVGLEPEAVVRISGRVDAPSTWFPNVLVEIRSADGAVLGRDVPDSEGRFDLAVPVAAGRVDLKASYGRHLVVRHGPVTLESRGFIVLPPLSFPASHVVEGEVRHADGRPVVGASVAVLGTGEDARTIRGVWRRQPGAVVLVDVSTDSRGRFTIEGVPPGDHRLFAMARGAVPVVSEISVPSGAALALKLPQAVVLEGHVRFGDGRGASNLVVTARRSGAASNWPGRFGSAVTDADGRFSIPGLEAGPFLLSVDPADPGSNEALAATGIAWHPDGGPANLVVERGAEITGRVTAPGGIVPADTTIRVSPAGEGDEVWANLAVREDGGFRVVGLPPGRYDLVASAPGWLPASRTNLPPGAKDVVLEFGSGRRLEGEVRWRGGSPAIGVRIEARPLGRETGSEVPGATSSADGAFAITGLTGEPYRMAVCPSSEHPRGLLLDRREPLGPGEEQVTLTVARPAAIEGTVVSRSGEELPGLEIGAVPEGDAGPVTTTRPRSGGSFRIEGLDPDLRYAITTRVPGVAVETRLVTPGTRNVRIEVDDGLRVAGTIVDSVDRPLARLEFFLRAPGEESGQWSVTNQVGRFLVLGRKAVTYEVVVPTEDGRSWRRLGVVQGGDRDALIRWAD